MKTCSKCKVEKPFDSFNKDKKRKDKLNLYCKECINAQYKSYRLAHKAQEAERQKRWRARQKPVETKGKKLCAGCREWKELKSYFPSNLHDDGYHPYCKPCFRMAM